VNGGSRLVDAAPSLPADRTFVVQFRAASDEPRDVALHGRVEHLVPGFASRFDTWSELQDFVEHVLLRADEAAAADGGSP
jgi:hypothetical protein